MDAPVKSGEALAIPLQIRAFGTNTAGFPGPVRFAPEVFSNSGIKTKNLRVTFQARRWGHFIATPKDDGP